LAVEAGAVLCPAPDVAPAPGPDKAARPRIKSDTGPWRNRIVGHADVAPDRLVPNPSNPRRHPAAQRAALTGSLDTVGWVAEATVNVRTGNLVDGHARLEEALGRGEPTIPVTYVDLSEDEERLVIATLDPIGAMASFDAARLDELLATLAPENDALAGLLDDLARANGLDALRAGLTDPDDVGPLPDPAAVTVRPGDRYVLGDHVLLVGDATSAQDVGRLLAGATPTLLATDPPYGVDLDLGWRDRVVGSGRAGSRSAVHTTTSLAGDTRADWSEAFALVPSLAVGYVWHAAVQAATVADGLARIGFVIVGQVIWDKARFTLGRSWYHWAHEPAWVVRRRGARVPFLGERNQGTIWRAPSPKAAGGEGADAPADHPTQKPVLLFETPIRNHLRPGEALYDPFVGSGTAVIAAERTGRRCYALELEPAVAQGAIERWQRYTGRQAVRDE
jgi:DNA modification methylase